MSALYENVATNGSVVRAVDPSTIVLVSDHDILKLVLAACRVGHFEGHKMEADPAYAA